MRHELQASHASANFCFLNMIHLRIFCKNLENSLQDFSLLISSYCTSSKIIRDFNTRNNVFLCSWILSPNSLKAKQKQKQQSSGSNHHDGVADRPPFTSCQHVLGCVSSMEIVLSLDCNVENVPFKWFFDRLVFALFR